MLKTAGSAPALAPLLPKATAEGLAYFVGV